MEAQPEPDPNNGLSFENKQARLQYHLMDKLIGPKSPHQQLTRHIVENNTKKVKFNLDVRRSDPNDYVHSLELAGFIPGRLFVTNFLGYAIYRNANMEIIKALLDAGANILRPVGSVQHYGSDKIAPIYVAARFGHPEALHEMLQRLGGIEALDAREFWGGAPLRTYRQFLIAMPNIALSSKLYLMGRGLSGFVDNDNPPIEEVQQILSDLSGKISLLSAEARPLREYLARHYGLASVAQLAQLIQEAAFEKRKHLLAATAGGRRRKRNKTKRKLRR